MRDSIRARAGRLAAEKYPEEVRGGFTVIHYGRRDAFVSGYLDGRTVSDEEVDKAASGIADCVQARLGSRPDPVEVWYMAAAAFRAAGLTVEGDE